MVEKVQNDFSSLIELFESMDIVEKGIEKVYDYLLTHETVDNLKELENELGLNLKRIYKIFSVLKDLGLVQIYDRPMKIQLLDPKVSWEKIIQKKVNEIREETDKKIQKCYNAFFKMKNAYNLTEIKQQPVEFIPYIGNPNFETLLHSLICEKESFIAHNIFYLRNPDVHDIMESNKKDKDDLVNIIKSFKKNTYKILVSEEYLEHIDKYISKNPSIVSLFKNLEITDISLDIRVTENQFINFTIKDKKILSQPSFDPNDNLIGYFISSPKEIVEVFLTKFDNLFEKAIPLIEKKKIESDLIPIYQILIAI